MINTRRALGGGAARPLARYITQTMPWATLLAGCLTGTALLAAFAHFADASHSPLDQGSVRITFLPAVAALAFVPRASFRPITHATPVPAWLVTAGQTFLAAPILAVTGWAQLRLLNHTIGHSGSTISHPPAVYPLLAQLAGWCALAVAAAACCDRSRYHELGGAVAAPVSLTLIAIGWYTPEISNLLVTPPAAPPHTTIAWYAIAAIASALTCAAMRDRWPRYTRVLRRHPGGYAEAIPEDC